MTKPIQNLKGFRDIFPEEAKKRQWLKNKIIEVFESWNYLPFETPTVEPLELFKGQIGEDEKLFFKFKDNAGRDVALRYDQTVPIARVMAQYKGKIKFPFRRYQIQSAFRAEKPQKGRYREFLQCDADIFGVKDPIADAEVIALTLDIYKQIGFENPQILINDRSLFKDLPYEAIVAIDKLEKIGEEGVLQDMSKKGISLDESKNYLNIVKNAKPNKAIELILNYLKNYGFNENWFKFEPTIARSFSYSDGPIWEVKIKEYDAGSVMGGERYDNLVKSISDIDVPATGFAIGFDRTLQAADQLGLIPKEDESKKILITTLAQEDLKYSLKIASKLRSFRLKVEIYSKSENNLSKQIKYAVKNNFNYVVILGEEEISQNKVTIKNIRSRQQKTISQNEFNNQDRISKIFEIKQ